MTREECIEKLNGCFKGNSLDGSIYLSLLSEFLTLEYPDMATQIIQLCMTQPMLLGQTIEKVMDYFVRKFEICKLSDSKGLILIFY